MKDFVDLAKWLLEKDIRAKNAASFLVALTSVVIFYFASRHCGWFREIEGHGAPAIVFAFAIVFLIAFLGTWLVYSGVATYHQQVVSRRQAQEEAERKTTSVRNNLETLTNWQRKFLLRFIVERRTQIPEFEVGRFKAAWDFEMDVLIEKGIVKEHSSAGVFEIEPVYHQYLLEHWSPQTGALE